MTADDLRKLIAYVEEQVQLADPDQRRIEFDVPDEKPLLAAGLHPDGVHQLLSAPWLQEMVTDVRETPEFCDSFTGLDLSTIKAIRVKDYADIKRAEDFFTDAILLDAFDSDKYGGTGLRFDWNIIGHIDKRIFLAGGIDPDNVVEALQLGVYGIDICSGVEAEPGKKDHKKMKQLFENIRHFMA